MLVPKAEELVANPYRHDGKRRCAKDSSRTGFATSSPRARRRALHDFPITVYYAFKQSEQTTTERLDRLGDAAGQA